MENRINKDIETYITSFKDNIRDKAISLGIQDAQLNPLLEYIYDYDRLSFDKIDFMKRKRVNNIVPFFERCCAKKASGEQCTRKKQNIEDEYCGTHMKGVPNGIMTGRSSSSSSSSSNNNNGGGDTNSDSSSYTNNGGDEYGGGGNRMTHRVEVWIQDIQGIVYYIDKYMNVYKSEDIMNGITNPKIIAKYVKNGDHYCIPAFI